MTARARPVAAECEPLLGCPPLGTRPIPCSADNPEPGAAACIKVSRALRTRLQLQLCQQSQTEPLNAIYAMDARGTNPYRPGPGPQRAAPESLKRGHQDSSSWLLGDPQGARRQVAEYRNLQPKVEQREARRQLCDTRQGGAQCSDLRATSRSPPYGRSAAPSPQPTNPGSPSALLRLVGASGQPAPPAARQVGNVPVSQLAAGSARDRAALRFC